MGAVASAEGTAPPPAARAALERYGLAQAEIVPVPAGLINRTYRVRATDGRSFALQRVNPIFAPAIHEDIAAVTAHLADKGLVTPRLVRAADGSLCVAIEDALWRLLTWIEGVSREALDDPRQARAAGALLARFHLALADFEHPLHSRRLGVHDTERHLRVLRETLDSHRSHPRYGAVAPLAARILEAAASLAPLPPVPDRLVHGDPKISNVLFDEPTGAAICLVDLDTLARMPLPLELGDALRSWCKRGGEDEAGGGFDLDLFGAAVSGYAAVARDVLTDAEWQCIVDATERIQIELAARFCADALRESYFAWDRRRFAGPSEHNEARAAGQLAAASALAAVRGRAQALVDAAFAR